MITIILTGARVSAILSEETFIFLQLLLPNLGRLLEDLPAPGLTKIYDLVCHICDIYKAHQKDWKGSHSGAKSVNVFCV